jgi:hypothetical protein
MTNYITKGKICFLCVTVCFAVVEKFAAGLTSDEKKDSKVIENKFRTYCKTAKNKEHRFVSLKH